MAVRDRRGPPGAGTVGCSRGELRSQTRMVVRSTKGYESITGTSMNGDPSRTVMK